MYNMSLINILLYFITYSLLTALFIFYTYIRTLLCVILCTKNYYSSNQVYKAAPHNSKCRCGEREVQAAKQKAQIILCAAKVSAASGGYSEPKQGQRSQSARGFCSRSTMRVPQPEIIEHFCNADCASQPPQRCLSCKAGIVRCCLKETLQLLSRQRVPSLSKSCTFLCSARRGEHCRPYLACSSSHRCISAFIPAKAFAVSGFSVLKSSSFHSQPCSATARRLSG